MERFDIGITGEKRRQADRSGMAGNPGQCYRGHARRERVGCVLLGIGVLSTRTIDQFLDGADLIVREVHAEMPRHRFPHRIA